MPSDGLIDGRRRALALLLGGGGAPEYEAYHDTSGAAVLDDDRLFERLCLEAFQSGLSWLTILRKRDELQGGLRRVPHPGRGRLRRRPTWSAC